MTVTLITTTGWRPKAFALAEKYVARQTYRGELQWLVVSDDKPETPTPCTMGQQYIQGPLVWRKGINTQRYNLAAAIPHIKGDVVLIWEDDDWYHPDYIKVMCDMLQYADLVGEGNVTYYSLKTRGFLEMNNQKHASLCQSGFTRKYIQQFENCVHSGEMYIDIILWNRARANQHKTLLFSGLNLCYGIKGVPGRTGIGVGHQNNNFVNDQNFVRLKEMLGEDAKPYIEMVK